VDVALAWNYGCLDEGDGFANLNGWYGSVNWEVTPQVGLTVEHESYWGGFHGRGANAHVWVGGVTVKLRKGDVKFSPFVQPMAGATRNESEGVVEWEPTVQIGPGADITLKGNLSLEVMPAEYTYTSAAGVPGNSFSAAAGFSYTFHPKS
jgi:hypothetical protein